MQAGDGITYDRHEARRLLLVVDVKGINQQLHLFLYDNLFLVIAMYFRTSQPLRIVSSSPETLLS